MYINLAQPFSPWFTSDERVRVWQEDSAGEVSALRGTLWQVPLAFSHDEQNWWRLPLDPVVSVQGGNSIVRQTVLKQPSDRWERRGSIKEVWAQDDYEVQIAGVLISDDEQTMPDEQLRRLRAFCEQRKAVFVQCDLLLPFNITRLAITNYTFQHTPGVQNRMFSIKAYSDDDFSLLIKS